MALKARNFKSRASEKRYMKFIHSNPAAKSAAARSGHHPIKVRGKSIKVSHRGRRK